MGETAKASIVMRSKLGKSWKSLTLLTSTYLLTSNYIY